MYFNTPIVYSTNKPIIDRENGLISNVVLAKPGEAKGHNLHLDSSFIDSVVSKGNDHKPGLKARFGHPNICSTALGTYLGRFKNFRKIDGAAVADMHLDKSAIKSPKGDLYGYVLDMAENNPDMFGASVAFKRGKNKEVKDDKSPGEFKQFATIKNLYAADFVDSPAATDGLFELFHEEDLAFQTTSFLDNHPEIMDILLKRPEVLNEFLTKYNLHKKNKSMNFADNFAKVSNWVTEQFDSFFADNAPDTPEDAIKNLSADFTGQLEDLKKVLSDENTRLETENKTLNAQVEDLTSKLNASLATPTSSASGDPKINIKTTKTKSFNVLDGAPDHVKRTIKSKLAKSN